MRVWEATGKYWLACCRMGGGGQYFGAPPQDDGENFIRRYSRHSRREKVWTGPRLSVRFATDGKDSNEGMSIFEQGSYQIIFSKVTSNG